MGIYEAIATFDLLANIFSIIMVFCFIIITILAIIYRNKMKENIRKMLSLLLIIMWLCIIGFFLLDVFM